MKNIKALSTTAFALALAAFTMADEVKAKSIQIGVVDAKGYYAAGTPTVGEQIGVWVTYTHVQQPLNSCVIRVKVANQVVEQVVDNEYPGNYDLFFSFQVPLDGKIDAELTVDPDNHMGETALDQLNNKVTTNFTPLPPASAVQYYAPKRYLGTITSSAYAVAGSGQRNFAWFTLKPTTETFQKVNAISTSAKIPGVMAGPMSTVSLSSYGNDAFTRSGVYTPSGWTSLSNTYDVTVSNVRVNPTILNNATWTQIDALKGLGIMAYNLTSEPEAPTNQNIKNYIISELGSNYRSTMTPYTAARRMFQRILKDIVYYHAADMPATAEQVLQQGRGDCGGFSLLIQACYRAMGIPTRITMGWWTGGDTHVWNEFYIPGAGWIICDGAIGNGWDETGKYAMCFGSLIDLNKRMINSRNFVHSVNGIRVPWLQGTTLYRSNYTFTNYSVARDLVPLP